MRQIVEDYKFAIRQVVEGEKSRSLEERRNTEAIHATDWTLSIGSQIEG